MAVSARPSTFALSSPGPVRLYSTTELLQMKPPTWMIEGLIPHNALVGLYGEPGCGKSFLSIGLALSVATGRDWHGHTVDQGYVLYVSAEGGAGIGKRVHAWLTTYGCDRRTIANIPIAWLLESIPVYAGSDEMAQLVERITTEVDRIPTLVVVDTLARCFDGDENQQQDMGRFIAGVDHLRSLWDATVIVVHHTRLAGDRERGNTAFRGAADTMLHVEKQQLGKSRGLRLTCNKQKDSEEHEALRLRLSPVPSVDSCVLADIAPGRAPSARSEASKALLAVLVDSPPLSFDLWQEASKVPRTTCWRTVKELEAAGDVVKSADGLWSLA